MKRKNWVFIALIILVNSNQVLCQEFNDTLLAKANELERNFGKQFDNVALLIKNYKFKMEIEPIDTIYQNFNDFINDEAANYFINMYNEVHNQTTGIPYIKNNACPPADPLSVSLGVAVPCSLTVKDEYALEQASDTLDAIAYEYSRKLKQLGLDIIKETGLLDKVIEMKTQQLVFANLPSMVVQDSAWIDQFKTEKNLSWDKLWGQTKQIAQEAGKNLLGDLKDDLYDIAGQKLDTWIESAKKSSGPLMDEVKKYRDKLTKAEEKVLASQQDISTAIDEKLSKIKDVTSQATESFVSYLNSTMEAFSTNIFIQPFQSSIKSMTDKIALIDSTPIILKVDDNLKKTTQEGLDKAITGITEISKSLQKEISNATNNFISPLSTLNSSIEKSLASLTASAVTDKIPEKIKTEVNAQLDDITSSLSTVKNDMAQDITALTNGFIEPISKSFTQLDKDIKTIKDFDLFGQVSAELSSSIQTHIKETTGLLNSVVSGFANGIGDLSKQLKNGFNTQSKDIQNILTANVTRLTDTSSSSREKIVGYLNDKIKIITDLVKLIDSIIAKIENVSGRDFLDLAESFILSPTKALQELENLTTCKAVDDKGKCTETYVDFLEKQLNITKIPDEFAEFYKVIIKDLSNSFQTFLSDVEAFIKDQEKKATSLFNQVISKSLTTGESTKDALISAPDTIKKLIKAIENQSLAQSKIILDKLGKIKNNLTAITDNFDQTAGIDDSINLIMKNKNNIKKIIQSLPDKIDTLTALLNKEAEGKADKLLTQLKDLKGIASSYSQALTQKISTKNLLKDFQDSIPSIDGLVGDITSGALKSISAPIKQLNSLRDTSKKLSSLVDNGKETLNKKIFSEIKETINDLNIIKLNALNQVKNFEDYSSFLQNAINSITSDLNTTTTTLLKEKDKADFIASFETENVAREAQIQLQKQLDSTILKFITIERDGNKLNIKPNFISVSTEKFYELIDDAIVLITDQLSKAFRTFS